MSDYSVITNPGIIDLEKGTLACGPSIRVANEGIF